MDLNKYKNIVTSQWGEDGIIEEIFKRIGTKNRTCVEFGAGPGKDLSNTWHLISSEGWRGILIEPNEELVAKWKVEIGNHNARILNQFVDIQGENSLDRILSGLDVPKNIDLISIDIDGDDYHIFKFLSDYEPRVAIVEYNPTIPPQMDLIQSPGEQDPYGASAGSMVKLAHEKGYRLAALTQTNCIFVHKNEFEKLNISEPKIEEVFDDASLTYLISSYGGSNFLKSRHCTPSYSWFYDTYNINLTRNSRHSISVGLSQNRRYSERLSADLIPVKIFLNKPSRNYGLFSFIFIVLSRGLVNFVELINRSFLGSLVSKIKKISKKIIPAQTRKWARKKEAVFKWHINGQPIPPPAEIKQRTVKQLGKKYGLTTLIETGTSSGEMIRTTKNNFRKIFSIELGLELYEDAKKLFSPYPHIILIHGDSGKKLSELLPKINEPVLFWLDAHYSGTGTVKGLVETPILKELDTILSRNEKKDVILIDDARCFDGTHDYPTIQQIQNIILSYGGYSLKVKSDIIRIEPA